MPAPHPAANDRGVEREREMESGIGVGRVALGELNGGSLVGASNRGYMEMGWQREKGQGEPSGMGSHSGGVTQTQTTSLLSHTHTTAYHQAAPPIAPPGAPGYTVPQPPQPLIGTHYYPHHVGTQEHGVSEQDHSPYYGNVSPDMAGQGQGGMGQEVMSTTYPALSPSAPLGTIEEIDNQFIDNPQSTCPYRRDIWDCLREAESKFRFSPTYMDHRPDITPKMRGVLFDWLADVHLKLKLQVPTLYLTLHIVDAYLDRCKVTRDKLQLVGMVGLLIASKYEEIYPPTVDKLVYLSAKTYSRQQVVDVERDVLIALEYTVTVATTYPFLVRALEVTTNSLHNLYGEGHGPSTSIDSTPTFRHMAHFIAELSLMDYNLLRYLPSVVGASCVLLARMAQQYLTRVDLSPNHEGDPSELSPSTVTQAISTGPLFNNTLLYFGYREVDLAECCLDLILTLMAPIQKTQAVRRKYTGQRFGTVTSLFSEPLLNALHMYFSNLNNPQEA